jgi:hypothetical protein
MHRGDILEETNLIVGDRWGDNVVVGQAAESLGVSDRSDGSTESWETEWTSSDVVGESSEDDLVKGVRGTGRETGKEERSVCYSSATLPYTQREGRRTMSNTDNLVELRNSMPDLSISEHLGDGGRLGDLVSDLNDLGTVRVGRSSDTKSIIRECSPVGSSGRLGKRVVSDTAFCQLGS